MSIRGPQPFSTVPAYPPKLPTAGMVPAPAPGMTSQITPSDPALLVAQLGTRTIMTLDGKPLFNEPLVASIISCRERAIAPLGLILQSSNQTATLMEALYTATRLAEADVQNMESLYPAAMRLNNHIDPMIQMQLARFYRKINEPKAFGAMFSTAVNYAVNQYQMTSSPHYNVTEEVGATLLNQIAKQTAQETVRQLLPFLQRPQPASLPPLASPPFLRQ